MTIVVRAVRLSEVPTETDRRHWPAAGETRTCRKCRRETPLHKALKLVHGGMHGWLCTGCADEWFEKQGEGGEPDDDDEPDHSAGGSLMPTSISTVEQPAARSNGRVRRPKQEIQRCQCCLQPLKPTGRLLDLIRREGPLTAVQLAERFGMKPRTVRYVLRNLPEDGDIEHIDVYQVRGPDSQAESLPA